jgi:hypothetical protein
LIYIYIYIYLLILLNINFSIKKLSYPVYISSILEPICFYVLKVRLKKNDFLLFFALNYFFCISRLFWYKIKNKKIILIHFLAKNTLKSNRYRIFKHPFRVYLETRLKPRSKKYLFFFYLNLFFYIFRFFKVLISKIFF